MSKKSSEAESRAEHAREKAVAAKQQYRETIEEVKEHFDTLLELRDIHLSYRTHSIQRHNPHYPNQDNLSELLFDPQHQMLL